MIFVIEKMFQDHKAQAEAWECARDKWLNEEDNYGYRSQRDYETRHPRPGHTLGVVAKGVLIGIMVAAVFGTIVVVTTGGSDPKPHQGQAATVQKKETKPAEFKVGDKVQVVYGDYEDSVGVIVKITSDSAIIKLTNSTLTHAMCNASSSCSEGGGHDDGELLGISKLDNLVPYKEVK